MPKMNLRLGKLSILFLLIFFFHFPTPGIAEDEVIRNFSSSVYIEENGTLLVREEITVMAAHQQINYGIYRDFPLKYTGPKKYPGRVPFKVISVTLDGQPLSSDNIERSGNNIRILMRKKYEKLSKGEHTFVLVYSTAMQVRSFPEQDYDELNWNVTGDGWAFPIEMASCEIGLPGGAAILKTTGWTGKSGSKDFPPKVTRPEPGRAIFVSSKSITPGEHFTVAVSFPKGVVKEEIPEDGLSVSSFMPGNPPQPGEGADNSFWGSIKSAYSESGGFFLGLFGILALLINYLIAVVYSLAHFVGPIGILVLNIVYYLLSWHFFGRDPKTGTIIPLFYPPLAGYYGKIGDKSAPPVVGETPMSPAAVQFVKEATTFTGKSFSSLFIELALRGLCKIYKKTEGNKEKFVVMPLEAQGSLKDVSPEEQEIHNALLDKAGPNGEFIVTERNAGAFKEIYGKVKKALDNRYAPLWSLNSGFNMLNWLIIMPLSIHLLDGSYYGDKEWAIYMLLAAIALVVLGQVLSYRENKFTLMLSLILKMISLWCLLVFLIMVIAGLVQSDFFEQPLMIVLMIVLILLPIIFTPLMKAPTKAGRALLDQIEGLAMYIKVAEKDRLTMLNAPKDTPEVFERLLPYAIAFGLEKTWCDRFADQLNAGLIKNDNISATAWTAAGISSFSRDFSTGSGSVSSYSTGSSSGGSAFSSSGGGSGSGGGGGGGGGI